MFIYDTMNQGLELLARRELQDAENLFLSVVNDPYSQPEETKQAKQYLNDIRDCKKGDKTLNFDNYKDLVKNIVASLDYVDELIADVYCSSAHFYAEIDQELSSRIPIIVNRLKQIKIRDISSRDKLFAGFEKSGARLIRKRAYKRRRAMSKKITPSIITVIKRFLESLWSRSTPFCWNDT